jgi:hypothetical protein
MRRAHLHFRLRLLALAVAPLALMLVADASAQPSHRAGGTAGESLTKAAMPTTSQARSIVAGLWARRESALASLQVSSIGQFETGSLKILDSAYVASVRCGCGPRKDAHPASAVVVAVPRAAAQPVFFAQVRTTTAHGRHPWYILAVMRGSDARWRLDHLTFGGYQSAPPLKTITNSSASTPAVTASSRARIAHLAAVGNAWMQKGTIRTARTAYGATIRRRVVLGAKDGISGLALPAGKVLSCFTTHTLETYTPAAGHGLQQNAARTSWLHQLAPGLYTSITVDNAIALCAVGSGSSSHPGGLRWRYDERPVAIRGVRA